MCCKPEPQITSQYVVANANVAAAAPVPNVVWWPDPTAAAPTPTYYRVLDVAACAQPAVVNTVYLARGGAA